MKINTPCIGICSTVYGDNVCRGCKRLYTEIIAWNTYSEEAQQNVFDRLAANIVSVTQDKIEVQDVDLLIQKLHEHSIRYRNEQNPLCWAYHVLRVMGNKITSADEYGFYVKPPYQQYTFSQLFTLIDKELLELSSCLEAQ